MSGLSPGQAMMEEQYRELKRDFAVMDVNTDGKVSRSELRQLILGLGEKIDENEINGII